MSNTVIVLVSDLDDTKHGEINIADSPIKAARLVETLLEAGFDRERIRIFTGNELGMQVTHRPVVALLNGDAPADGASGDSQEATQEAPAKAAGELELQEAASGRTKAQIADTTAIEKVTATPFVKNGVRFSTLFRPA